MSHTIKKLKWTLQCPDDWGLRYSACLALESICTTSALELLKRARQEEVDTVVSMRISKALSRFNTKEQSSIFINNMYSHQS